VLSARLRVTNHSGVTVVSSELPIHNQMAILNMTLREPHEQGILLTMPGEYFADGEPRMAVVDKLNASTATDWYEIIKEAYEGSKLEAAAKAERRALMAEGPGDSPEQPRNDPTAAVGIVDTSGDPIPRSLPTHEAGLEEIIQSQITRICGRLHHIDKTLATLDAERVTLSRELAAALSAEEVLNAYQVRDKTGIHLPAEEGNVTEGSGGVGEPVPAKPRRARRKSRSGTDQE
jgi:hypothetical protein